MKFKLFQFIISILLIVGCQGDQEQLGPRGLGFPSPPPIPGTTTPTFWTPAYLPLAIKIGNNFSAIEIESTKNAINSWNVVTSFSPTIFDPSPDLIPSVEFSDLDEYRLDSPLGIYFNSKWFSDVSSFALAVTYSSGYRYDVGTPNEHIELEHADIIINKKNFSFSHDFSSGTYDLESVILHELGHFVGLPHNNDPTIPSVMAPRLSSSTDQRKPFLFDEENIRQLYTGHRADPLMIEGNFIKNDLDSKQKAPVPVILIYELNANGKCRHFENNKLVFEHQLKLNFN